MGTKNCYCWLFMLNDRNFTPLSISIFSMLRTKPKADLVLMIDQNFPKKFKKFFEQYVIVKEIDILFLNKYSGCVNYSYTKFLSLDLIEYKKVLYLDTNTIFFSNIDHLFELTAPAACFGFKKINHLSPEIFPKHGETITHTLIKKCFEENMNFFMVGTILLVEPSKSNLNSYKTCIESECFVKFLETHIDIGLSKDEFSALYYYSLINNNNWTNISYVYLFSLDYIIYNGVKKSPFVFYFKNTKPWATKSLSIKQGSEKYENIVIWFNMVKILFKNNVDKISEIGIKKEIFDTYSKDDSIFFKKMEQMLKTLKPEKRILGDYK